MTRNYNFFDKLCFGVDQAVRALTDTVKTTDAPFPEKDIENKQLSEEQAKHSARLMRINHAGEICAQALYQGQSFVAKDHKIQAKMDEAALEEGNHLKWCKQRLDELHSHTSYLNPFWYCGSFCLGLLAGMIGDKWSMGFLAETERQVVKHLEGHLALLKIEDPRSYHVLQQMQEDEARHRDEALALGGKELPHVVKQAMSLTSKIMVKISYWV